MTKRSRDDIIVTDEEVHNDPSFKQTYDSLLISYKDSIKRQKLIKIEKQEKKEKKARIMKSPYFVKLNSIPEKDRKFIHFNVPAPEGDYDMMVLFPEGLTGRQILEQFDPNNELKLKFENPVFENEVIPESHRTGVYYVLDTVSYDTILKLHDEILAGFFFCNQDD